ncbi:MAG: hypothetical protein ACM3ML_09990 [Micromonosporaceae bacterium]
MSRRAEPSRQLLPRVVKASPGAAPPRRHNFLRILRIRSERPAFDLHYSRIPAGRPRELERQSAC